MAYSFDPIFAADPSNPANVAANAAILIYDPNDAGKAPVTITDLTGSPIPNPVTVNKNGFGSAFQHATLDRLAWSGAGFEGFFTSYEGMKEEAVAARAAAEAAGATAAVAAAEGVAPVVAEAEAAADAAAAAQAAAASSATAAANSAALVGAPADAAMAAAANNTGSQFRAALSATYAPVSGSSVYAPKASPAFTGTPTLNGQPIGTASFKVTEDPNEAFDPGQLLIVVEPPAPWTLADLGFSMLWEASALAIADGAQITSWADTSGNSHTLTKISTNGPTLDLDGFGGKPAAIFTGAQYLDTAAFTAMTDRITIVVIGQTTSTVNSESFVDSTTAPDRVALFKAYNAGSPTFRMERGSIGGQSVATTNADFNDLPHVFIASFNGTSEVSRLYIDGVAKGNGGSPMATSNSVSTIRVGGRSDAGNLLDGKIAAVGILDRTLTGPEISQIQTYAAATWGI